MKTIFEDQSRQDLLARIMKLDQQSQPKWGKMNVYQMIKHCSLWEEMVLSKRQFKRTFLGRIFGKVALKDILKDKPMKRNVPTVPGFKIQGDGDITVEQRLWIDLIEEHARSHHVTYPHSFFGNMTREEWQTGSQTYRQPPSSV